MNNYEYLEEVLKLPYDERLKWRVIYVNDYKSLWLLQEFFIKEWRVRHTVSDFNGGVYYTIEKD